jgi:hypothetical protein
MLQFSIEMSFSFAAFFQLSDSPPQGLTDGYNHQSGDDEEPRPN